MKYISLIYNDNGICHITLISDLILSCTSCVSKSWSMKSMKGNTVITIFLQRPPKYHFGQLNGIVLGVKCDLLLCSLGSLN